MRTYSFVTVDVFTDRPFGGNPLAVFPNALGLTDGEMQALAAEFNLSETTFVLPPEDPRNTARVRIFHRRAEMPFAGHPNVGTACVLAGMRRDQGGVLRFEELAGLVEIEVESGSDGFPQSATVAAPQPLALGVEILPETVARCAGLHPQDVVVSRHPPVEASVGVPFVLAEVRAAALARATPDLRRFREALDASPGLTDRFSLHLYSRIGNSVRARMFAPIAGTIEDPATGSANAALGALLLSLTDAEALGMEVRQGEEMGRPSLLRVHARRAADGIRAKVAGGCVPMFRGEVSL